MHYYQHNIKDFRSGVINFTREERWLYRDMLDVYYDTESPLPTDIQNVCDAIGALDSEHGAVAKILRIKFTKTDNGWVHERCEVELENYRLKATTARVNGKNGGRPPKNNPAKTQRVPTGLPLGSGLEPDSNPNETGLKANQEPITNNQEPIQKVQTIVEPDAPTSVAGEMVNAVFSYWQNQRGHERAKLDKKRASAIKARLKDGYTVEYLCSAVDGISKSSHHMGQNDSGAVYDDIELICRNGPNVDRFAKLAGAVNSGISAGLQRQIDVLNDWIGQE